MAEIGLFPLPLVLLPSEQLPLHIFEERYQDLIGECLEDDREFGVVFSDDGGIRDVGTRAAVVEVLRRFDDGRMNILVEGVERFKLVELTSGRSFQTGRTAPLPDEDDPPKVESVDHALELFARLRELTGSEVEMPPDDSPRLSYALAARVELDNEVKLELLREVSERVRLDRVSELLVVATSSVERRRLAGERASSNGRVDLG